MKRKHIFLIGIVAVAVLLLLVLRQNKQGPQAVPSERVADRDVKNVQSQKEQTPQNIQSPQLHDTATSNPTGKPHPVEEWIEQQYKHPISFYGKVVDEVEAPIAGASIGFDWPTAQGEDHASAASDSLGCFSLMGVQGKLLEVHVSKDGYYTSKQLNQARFVYAVFNSEGFQPDSSNPIIFQLRKKGPGTELITSKTALRPDLGIKAPTNGVPIFVDFYNRKTGTVGELQIESWKEHKDFNTGQNNWGLRLTISDGGFVEENDEFPFEAPETGYQSVMEWHFKNGQNDWQETLNKSYYIKFGNPPCHGKITVETDAFSQAIFLEYAVNPDGSRYLESK